jgi:hypothetical protein
MERERLLKLEKANSDDLSVSPITEPVKKS